MRAVDTNVLVRLITRDDPDQVAAAQSFIAGGAWASHVVVAEMAWVLDTVYGLSPRAIAGAITMLLQERALTIQDADVVSSALEQYRANPRVGFSDCLVLELARKAGHLPLGTFDRTLARLPGAEIL
jgi:predicted nucleic-acid-binding protein